jgi:thioredoxin-like negative regulator of GroEL
MKMLTRSEHLAWAKARALAYCDEGNINEAFTSLASDLSKNPETADHKAMEHLMSLMLFGEGMTVEDMRRYIKGMN